MTQATETTSASAQRSGGWTPAGACVVLAGAIRPSPLVLATQSPVLDLWLGAERTVLEHWLDRVAPASAPGSPVRVVHDAKQRAPAAPKRGAGLSVTIVAEPRAFRGPAGILRDVCTDLDPDATVLVGDAGRWLSASPTDLLAAHAARGASVTVAVNPDGSPGGLYAIRARALEQVPKKGFIDIKEQWLTRLAGGGSGVWTHRLAGAGTLPLRTREQFLEAARLASGGGAALAMQSVWRRASASAAWRSVSSEAVADPTASIVESVVMPGAEVGAGAAVVRSILCPEARVEAGEIVNAEVRLGRGRDRMPQHKGSPPTGGRGQ